MKATQLELFKPETESEATCSQSFTITLIQDGIERVVSDKDIDLLEKQLGPCENDDGVSLWWLIRRLAQDGVKKVKLV